MPRCPDTAPVRQAIAEAGGLCTVPRMAEVWGKSKQRVAQIVELEGFPEPLDVLGKTKVWLAADVECWRMQRT